MCLSESVCSPVARVMVVDDEESIRHAVCELLLTENISAVSASGAKECLEHLAKGFKGIILMDVMMPEKNGWETIRDIENAGFLHGNIISMLTAMDVPDEQMEGLQEVIIDYIVKPFDPEEFVVTIRRYLNMLDQLNSGTCS